MANQLMWLKNRAHIVDVKKRSASSGSLPPKKVRLKGEQLSRGLQAVTFECTSVCSFSINSLDAGHFYNFSSTRTVRAIGAKVRTFA